MSNLWEYLYLVLGFFFFFKLHATERILNSDSSKKVCHVMLSREMGFYVKYTAQTVNFKCYECIQNSNKTMLSVNVFFSSVITIFHIACVA